MSGPFNVGDVVVAVDGVDDDDGREFNEAWVYVGGIYSVECCFRDPAYSEDPWAITIPRMHSSWPASCFRHLPRATEEFTQQMRALRPIGEPVA